MEWVAIPSSGGSSRPRGRTCVSCIGRQVLYRWTTWEALTKGQRVKSLSRVRLSATPGTAAYHTAASMGFSRQEHWSGLPLRVSNSEWNTEEGAAVPETSMEVASGTRRSKTPITWSVPWALGREPQGHSPSPPPPPHRAITACAKQWGPRKVDTWRGHVTRDTSESLLVIWGHWLLEGCVCVEVFRCYHDGAAHAACTRHSASKSG